MHANPLILLAMLCEHSKREQLVPFLHATFASTSISCVNGALQPVALFTHKLIFSCTIQWFLPESFCQVVFHSQVVRFPQRCVPPRSTMAFTQFDLICSFHHPGFFSDFPKSSRFLATRTAKGGQRSGSSESSYCCHCCCCHHRPA